MRIAGKELPSPPESDRGTLMQTMDGKPAAEALQHTEARSHAILTTAVDAVVVIGAAGTVETFNPGAERMFGYAAAEVIGLNVCMLMSEPYRGQHDGYLEHYLTIPPPPRPSAATPPCRHDGSAAASFRSAVSLAPASLRRVVSPRCSDLGRHLHAGARHGCLRTSSAKRSGNTRRGPFPNGGPV
jgi:PAS domain S-box-containing protein